LYSKIQGLFSRALAPLKMAPALAPLKEQLLWRSRSRSEKMFGKTAPHVLASSMVDIKKAILYHVYVEELAQNVS